GVEAEGSVRTAREIDILEHLPRPAEVDHHRSVGEKERHGNAAAGRRLERVGNGLRLIFGDGIGHACRALASRKLTEAEGQKTRHDYQGRCRLEQSLPVSHALTPFQNVLELEIRRAKSI